MDKQQLLIDKPTPPDVCELKTTDTEYPPKRSKMIEITLHFTNDDKWILTVPTLRNLLQWDKFGFRAVKTPKKENED